MRSRTRRPEDRLRQPGEKIVYFAGIDTSEFNYGSYVQALKSKGVQIVYFIGPYQDTVRLQQTMQQASYKPAAFVQDPTIYDADYVKQAGSAASTPTSTSTSCRSSRRRATARSRRS